MIYFTYKKRKIFLGNETGYAESDIFQLTKHSNSRVQKNGKKCRYS